MVERDASTSPKRSKPGRRGKRKALPRSGLAEEILEQEDLDPAAEHDAVPAAGDPGSDEPATGPDRIFAFADSLEDEAGSQSGRQDRVELETWVSFELAAEVFALPVSHVQEILRVSGITRVPHAPHPVCGITNKRGRVLPVVGLRLRLGLPETELSGRNRILVVESRGRLLGLLVDAVQQVVRIDRSAIQEAPADVLTASSDYILGVAELDGSLVILLDVDPLLIIRE